MIILFAICMTVFTMYVDACVCLSIKYKYNWKASLLMAVFWPVSLPLTIVAIVKETKDYSQEKAYERNQA